VCSIGDDEIGVGSIRLRHGTGGGVFHIYTETTVRFHIYSSINPRPTASSRRLPRLFFRSQHR
jgi:hypothetical protein